MRIKINKAARFLALMKLIFSRQQKRKEKTHVVC